MEQVAEIIKAHVEKPYRALVKLLGDGKKFDITDAVDILTRAGRSPEQLDADVERLLNRRADVVLRAEVHQLSKQIEAAVKEYGAIVSEVDSLKTEFSIAENRKRHDDNLETRKAFNQVKQRLNDAQDARSFAFRTLSSLRDRRDKLQAEVFERLTKTGIPNSDVTQAENFALSE